jgi:hypothetical protein
VECKSASLSLRKRQKLKQRSSKHLRSRRHQLFGNGSLVWTLATKSLSKPAAHRPVAFPIIWEKAQMAQSNILGCPERPPCPNCRTNMITIGRKMRRDGWEWCSYQCLKCRHSETSQPRRYGLALTAAQTRNTCEM